jgi:hypothetical protein
MWSSKQVTRRALSLAAILAAACASNTAPSGFLPTPREAQRAAFGGWIELELLGTARQQTVQGELLAVTADTVWVLSDSAAEVLPTSVVGGGKLTAWRSGTGAVAGGTVLGVLSTISNGVLLIFTAPLWIVTGTVAGTSESFAPQRDMPPLRWAELARFARFPQGMPLGLALETLERGR